jgi:hypothetical protein
MVENFQDEAWMSMKDGIHASGTGVGVPKKKPKSSHPIK